MANPNSVSMFSQFMLDLQSAAQGVPGIVSSQVLIGSLEFYQNENFYAKVAKGGYWIVIGMPQGEADFFDFNSAFQVVAEIFYPIPADESFNWVPVNEQLAALIGGWSHWTSPGSSGPPNYTGGSEWVKGANRSPIKMHWGLPERRYNVKPFGEFLKKESFIVSSKFTFVYNYIADQVANPYLVPAA